LRELDARLADLERHVGAAGTAAGRTATACRQPLVVVDLGGPCCDAAAAVTDVAEGGCACCAPAG